MVDFAKEGAPNIRKYTCIAEEGYGFVHIVNDEKSCSYKETVQYQKFDGLELMKPHKGTSYDLKVGPGEKKTVLIRQKLATGFSMSSCMQNGVIYAKEKLMELCKTSGKKTQRVNPQNK